jgi:hypothetical protein
MLRLVLLLLSFFGLSSPIIPDGGAGNDPDG